jgi:DNA polymerase-3 subunit gamma/tau
MLSTPAFNALLKTLEEPPAHVIFIFATTEPKKIPSTIQSRCQHHAFRRISKKMIKEQLRKIADAEEINIRDIALELIARAADGSMRDALTLLDQASSFSDDITEKELQILLGFPEAEVISNLTENILAGDISNTLSIIKELTERGYDLRSISRELVEHFRNIAIVKVTEDAAEFLEFTPEDVQLLKHRASGVSIEQLTLLLTELLKLESEVRNAINPRYTLELGLLRTSFIKGMTSIKDVLRELGGSKVYEDPSEPAANKSKVPSENKKDPAERIASQNKSTTPDKKDLWKKLIEVIDSEDHLLACKLAEANILDISETELKIGFNGGLSLLADSVKKSSSLIEKKLNNLTGNAYKLKITSISGKTATRNIDNIKQKVISEPLVQNAMRLFHSSILEVKSLKDENNT